MFKNPKLGRAVVIDAFPESAAKYRRDHVIVSVDVIRATTVAVTAVACGRQCVVARDVRDAFSLRQELGDALLAGELKGIMPVGFDMNNSPADLHLRADVHRPLVMLSSSGTQLILQASTSREAAFVACFRNAAATAAHLIDRFQRVAVIGAGSRNEFREEDQMCCAWIASSLLNAGYEPEDEFTRQVSERWANAPAEACANGNSVAYLRRSGQMRDYDFVVNHINDLDFPVAVSNNQVLQVRAAVAA